MLTHKLHVSNTNIINIIIVNKYILYVYSLTNLLIYKVNNIYFHINIYDIKKEIKILNLFLFHKMFIASIYYLLMK
jgi:hypothetical protein